MRYKLRRSWVLSLLTCAIFGLLYWLIPIPGQVLIIPEDWGITDTWPQVRLGSIDGDQSKTARISILDTTPWVHVKLVVDGKNAILENASQIRSGVWQWFFRLPHEPAYHFVFYHSCDTGCQTWAMARTRDMALPSSDAVSSERVPTKLGVVFNNPQREWHSRSGWNVELTYALEADSAYWGIDQLSKRVQQATQNGLRVLVRVDYDRGQSIPAAEDYEALSIYLDYIRRLARDDRLKDVYGYVIGSGFNALDSNQQSPDHPVTPEWYARVFNGYGADPRQRDNVVETIHLENPTIRVLVGPVRPWIMDQNGERTHTIDVPWLNYLNTLTAAIDASAAANEVLGISNTAPDGFALQAPGRPDAIEFGEQLQADEPLRDLSRSEWNGAQAGFRVYRDWLEVINTYKYTRYLPAYITSTNTYTPDLAIPPAENYPRGWLTTALKAINDEPQIQALCWFMDNIPDDPSWERFRLTDPQGFLIDAAEEFDALLTQP